MMTERFTIGLTPLQTAARAVRHRRALRSQLISAALSLLVLGALYFFFREQWGTSVFGWFGALWLISTLAWVAIPVIGGYRAKRDLASIGRGDAVVIDSVGIEFLQPHPVRATWAEITALRIAGRNLGAGPDLVLEVHGAPAARVPLSFLDATPSAIESAVMARSMGRVRLDASGMERML